MKWQKITATLLACGMFLNSGFLHIPKKKNVQKSILKEEEMVRLPVAKTPLQKAREAFLLAESHEQKKTILKSYLKYRMKELGYTPKEYQQVKWIWSKESAFKWKAENLDAGGGSSPKGIPQIRWSKWGKWNRDPFKQMELGLKYIKSRYDSVEHAYNTKKETGEY